MTAAERATAYQGDMGFAKWALVELVEAAVHCGLSDAAAAAFRRLTAMTGPSATDWGLGLAARSHALLSSGTQADDGYREAIERLGRTRVRVELARAHLLYGEWLRREGRRADARPQLRTAHEMLDGMGVAAFAERARRELAATREKPRKRAIDTVTTLTAQEAYIARLASQGHTNAEIGAQLYLSMRTVEWHLGKIFSKSGVGSRRALPAALQHLGPDRPAARSAGAPGAVASR